MTTPNHADSTPHASSPREDRSTDAPEEAAYSEAVTQTARAKGIVMLIGATDTGKTTFCKAAVDAALALGRRVAVLDADSGQSEIGPPTTLGLGIPEALLSRLSDLKPRALAFVGSISPPGYLLEWAIGTRSLADRARELGADLILVDMPGLVAGSVGVRLQQSVAEALTPAAYVLLERKRELHILQRGLPPGAVYRPGVSSAAHLKTPTVRSLRRSARYAEYFENAREWELPVDRCILRGGSFFLGRPLRQAAVDELQAHLTVRLMHVERGEEGVRVVTAGTPKPSDLSVLNERLGRRMTCLEAVRLKHLIVGLLDHTGETVAIGSVQRVDFRRRRLKIATPWLDPENIGGIVWGTARATPEGKELEALRRGEV